MNNNIYWGFMIYLSEHMWGDEDSPARGWYIPKDYSENNSTDVATWDATVQYLGTHGYNMLLVDVGDGMKFDSHPEISAPNAWDKDFLKKKLDEARALGLTPIPKLNFSTCHSTWMKEYRRMVSTPTYYRVCADLIKEVCEAFGNSTWDSTRRRQVPSQPKCWWSEVLSFGGTTSISSPQSAKRTALAPGYGLTISGVTRRSLSKICRRR